ncbi:hypothetical protein I6N95_01705 [Vagococcus sp. BWB3-3]|uniref:Uncharacterized protein n=1 Tax=Vagococcus allomyrinae TaxID=2794353 RepID=A0A940P763_9ENTE|nr:hypothetical protein [Vagococcus allomyrinae]MBP1039714.1 hypothetical protein [Vagococcus allomyrinae]
MKDEQLSSRGVYRLKSKQRLLVDLDRTVTNTNPEEAITKAIRYAMEQLEMG